MENETSSSQSREATIGVAAAASLAAPFRVLARLSLPVRCGSLRVTVAILSTAPALACALSTCFADGDSTLMPPQICKVVKPVVSIVHSYCNRTTGVTECQNTYPRNTDLTPAHATLVDEHKTSGSSLRWKSHPSKTSAHCTATVQWVKPSHVYLKSTATFSSSGNKDSTASRVPLQHSLSNGVSAARCPLHWAGEPCTGFCVTHGNRGVDEVDKHVFEVDRCVPFFCGMCAISKVPRNSVSRNLRNPASPNRRED